MTLDGRGTFRLFVIGTPPAPGQAGLPTGYNTIVNLLNLNLINGNGNPLYVHRNLGSGFSKNETVGKRDGGCVYAFQGALLNIENVMFNNCKTVGT